MLGPLKSMAQTGAYHLGVLSAYHRTRNADTLTVVSFHRVLPADHPDMPAAMREFTVTTEVFEDTLRFMKRAYSIVGMDEVLDAWRGTGRLPPYAATVTFDDGWADNEEFAAPILRRHGVPATLFLTGGALDGESAFWREALYSAARLLPADRFAQVWRDHVGEELRPARSPDRELYERIGWAERLPPARREALLGALGEVAGQSARARMMTADQARAWAREFDLGGHGYRHDWMTEMSDLPFELGESRRALRTLRPDARSGWPETMSFPHGRYDERVTAEARRAGYELLFTSDGGLNRTVDGRLRTDVLGRVFGTMRWTTRRERFSAKRAASFFFRAPLLELDGQGPGETPRG